jgi:hypothetical protein
MNLLIKNKNQWSTNNNGQNCTLINLVEKSFKLKCEVGHMEFVEINIIMHYAVESKLSPTCSRKLVVKKWPFSPNVNSLGHLGL